MRVRITSGTPTYSLLGSRVYKFVNFVVDRIMRVVNKNKESYTVYIGRPSIFGNPFEIGKDGTREEVVAKYEVYARGSPVLMEAIKRLWSDAVLGCYCHPKLCHGDIIIKIWNEFHTPL